MTKILISRDEWMEAAAFGRIDTLNRWLQSGVLGVSYSGQPVRANIFDVTDSDKRNALFNAIEYGQVEYAKRLLEVGVFAETRNIEGQTPLAKASENGIEEIVSLLLSFGHGVEVQDKKGCVPLTRAIVNKHVPVVKLLLENGARVDPNIDRQPLYDAVGTNCPQIVDLLLEHGANPNAASHNQSYALHRLSNNWSPEDSRHETPRRQILRALLMAGVDTDNPCADPEECFFKDQYIQTFNEEAAKCNALKLERSTLPLSKSRSTTPRL